MDPVIPTPITPPVPAPAISSVAEVTAPPIPTQNVAQANTSGMGNQSVIPEEIKGWSWGGFLWTWIWAIGNKTWIGLIGFIYPISIIIAVVLGVKGREWAWRNKKWDSIETFNKTQRNWSKWWLIIVGSLTGFAIIGILVTIVLVAVDPQKQMRIANCVQNCQTTTDPLVCQENCK